MSRVGYDNYIMMILVNNNANWLGIIGMACVDRGCHNFTYEQVTNVTGSTGTIRYDNDGLCHHLSCSDIG
jgi:hypothetical protein